MMICKQKVQAEKNKQENNPVSCLHANSKSEFCEDLQPGWSFPKALVLAT